MTESDDPGPTGTGPTDDETLAADDIVELNRQMVMRAAAFARLAGTALVVAGAIGAVAWAWMAVRTQQRVSHTTDVIDPFDGDTSSDVPFVERVDLLATQISAAVIAVLTAGVGLGLRLVADYAVARTGGSLTGYEVGDQV